MAVSVPSGPCRRARAHRQGARGASLTGALPAALRASATGAPVAFEAADATMRFLADGDADGTAAHL